MKAYVTVQVRSGTDFLLRSKFEGLKEDFPAIKAVDVIYGQYDLMVTLESEHVNEFYKGHAAITGEPDCQSTSTFIVAEPQLILEARRSVAEYVQAKSQQP